MLVQVLGQRLQLDRAAVEAVRETRRALERAVRDREARRALRGEVRRAQLDHFAGTDEEHVLVFQAREDAGRELDGRRGHGNAVCAHASGRAYFLGDGKRALEKPVQHRAERSGRLGGARRFLHLAEDLRLAEHHRVQPRSDPERVKYRLFLVEGIKVRGELAGAQAVILREPRGDGLRLLARDVQLGAVARRKDRRLLGEAALHLGERLAQALDVEHHALAYRERSCLMVQAESIE